MKCLGHVPYHISACFHSLCTFPSLCGQSDLAYHRMSPLHMESPSPHSFPYSCHPQVDSPWHCSHQVSWLPHRHCQRCPTLRQTLSPPRACPSCLHALQPMLHFCNTLLWTCPALLPIPPGSQAPCGSSPPAPGCAPEAHCSKLRTLPLHQRSGLRSCWQLRRGRGAAEQPDCMVGP